jgi:hypothetical protein
MYIDFSGIVKQYKDPREIICRPVAVVPILLANELSVFQFFN